MSNDDLQLPPPPPPVAPVPQKPGERPLASALSRFVAYTGDSLLAGFVAGLVGGAAAAATGSSPAESPAAFWSVVVVLVLGYFVVTEATFSATPVKLITGLRVQRADNGGRIGLGQALVRNLIRPIDLFPFAIIGLVSMAISKRDQRLGDRAAGTVVVRTR
jgi:uncharacterized RDD family membrane protein YckC